MSLWRLFHLEHITKFLSRITQSILCRVAHVRSSLVSKWQFGAASFVTFNLGFTFECCIFKTYWVRVARWNVELPVTFEFWQNHECCFLVYVYFMYILLYLETCCIWLNMFDLTAWVGVPLTSYGTPAQWIAGIGISSISPFVPPSKFLSDIGHLKVRPLQTY